MKTNAHSKSVIPIRTSWAHVAAAVAILTTALSLVMIAFAWPAIRSGMHEVPVGIVGPAPAVAQVQHRLESARPGAFEIHPYGAEAAATQAITDRTVYGAIILKKTDAPTVLTASAASPAVAQGLTQLAQSIGGRAATPGPAVRDVVAVPINDPRGAGIAAGAFPLVLAGVACAVLLARRVHGMGRRTAAAVGFAIVAGLALTAILQLWLGALSGSYWANSAVVSLGLGAMSLALLGLQAAGGAPAMGLGSATMILIGNPLSGLTSAPEMLPSGWGTVGQLLPPGALGTALRSTAYFDGAGSAMAFVVLSCWLVAGLLLLGIGAARYNRPTTVAETTGSAAPVHVLATATAAGSRPQGRIA